MTAQLIPFGRDRIAPQQPKPVTISVDGDQVEGVLGQSIAGILLASGRLGFRTTSVASTQRGVFCGIGVCFDCLVEVNGVRDVRACQRRASEGDVVVTQHDLLPGGDAA